MPARVAEAPSAPRQTLARHGHLEARGAQPMTGADQVITMDMAVRSRA